MSPPVQRGSNVWLTLFGLSVMSEKQEQQSQEQSPNATPSENPPPIPIRSLVRKSRAEWLQELCESLEVAKTQPQPPDETSNRASRRDRASQIVLYKPPEPTLPPKPKLPNRFVVPKIPTKIPFNLVPLALALLVLVPGGIAVLAVSLLFRLPALPNCPKIFWPVASASLRFYCAEVAANKATVEDLLTAIDLVNALPKDHPMRPEINRQVEQWSMDILNLAEEQFQAGQLSEAIAIAEKIPEKTPARSKVSEKINQWRSAWDEAEKIYETAEDLLRKEKLNLAFKEATLLLNLDNNYWATTKYQEITDYIAITREESQKLAEARQLVGKGGIDNFVAALKLISELPEQSYLQEAGQKEIADISNKIMVMAEETLKKGDFRQAIDMANKIPNTANLQDQVQDFILLAQAHVPASLDTVAGLKEAIAQAQKLGSNRPLYSKAQEYIRNWQASIGDVATLERARKLAEPGGINNLKAAIAQLQTIPVSNPRGQEAQATMMSWTQEIEEIEDKPYLDLAEQLASFGDVNSLRQAIAQAQKINRGRALFEDAQSRINEWTERSERLQYQPLLDQAEQLASQGDYAEAISVAQQIRPGVVLYEAANNNIRKWKAQLQDIENLRNGETLAAPGTPDSYVAAIKMVDRVTNNSGLRARANQLINQWSQSLFQLGLDQSSYDLPGAIAILKKIPPGSSAYSSAQTQIQDWQQWLNPPAPQPEYQPPVEEYQPPVEEYQPPVEEYQPPVEEYQPPSATVSPSPVEPTQPPIELNKPIT